MRRVFLSLLIFIAAGLARGEVLPILPKAQGLNTDTNPLLITDGKTPDAENILSDESGGLRPRLGFTRFSTQTVSQEWVFPHSNGTRYIIGRTSNTIMASIGNSNFTIFVATVDPNQRTAAAVLGDKWFFGNQTDVLKYWDSGAVIVTSSTIHPGFLAVHKGRLWAAGILTDERTIYGSEYLQGWNFTLAVDPVETDPVRIQVQGALDENVAGLYASFNDLLMWFKPTSFGGIYGSKRTTFGSRSYSETVGSAYNTSIQDCDGELRFIGPRRRIYAFGGNSSGQPVLRKISDDIDTLMGTVSQGDLNQRNWEQTTQSDWQAGVLGNNLSATSSPGSIIYPSMIGLNENFEDNNYTSNPTWTVDFGSYAVSNGNLANGTGFAYGEMYTDMTVAYATYYFTNNFNLSSNAHTPYNGVTYSFNCGNALCTSGGYTLWISTANAPNAVTYHLSLGGNFSVNVQFSSAVPLELATNPTKVVVKPNGIEVFRSSTIFVGGITVTPPLTSTYFRTSYRSSVLSISSISIMADIFLSTFTSQSFNIGSNITSWGAFTAEETLNDGSIAYNIYSSTSQIIDVTNGNTYTEKGVVVNGAIPTIATGPYVLVYATFTRTASTQAITLDEFNIRWNEGSTLDVASAWTNQRYLLGVSISSGANNKALVYDRNLEWHVWSNYAMTTAVIFNSNLLFGNASGIWQGESGTTDNGAAITAYYKTKDFAPGKINYRTTFRDLYVTTTESPASLQTEFFVNATSLSNAMPTYAMDTESGLQDFRIPFPQDTVVKNSKTISFKWTVSSVYDWNILWANLYHDPEIIPTD